MWCMSNGSTVQTPELGEVGERLYCCNNIHKVPLLTLIASDVCML